MDAKTQIITLLFSFLYGFIFFYLEIFHNHIIKHKKRLYRSIITILFMCNIVLIYIILIFKLNNGNFHIYFILMIIIGFIISIKIYKNLLNNVKCRQLIEKIKKKCYTKKNKG